MEGIASFIPEPELIPLPAPVWLLQVLLFITFVLHLIPMNMTVGGLVILTQGEISQRFPEPMRRWITGYLPITTAFTITTGVAPLLFLQVLYGQLFFPAAVLVAWSWFAVIIALLLGYYGIYAYSLASDKLRQWRNWVVIGSTLLFLYIAFTFNNVITLMSTPFRWWEFWQERNPITHFNLNLWEPTLFPRFAHFVLSAIAFSGLVTALYGSIIYKRDENAGRQLVRSGVSWFVDATVINYFFGALFLFTHEQQIWQTFIGGNLWATVMLWGGVALSLVSVITVLLSRKSARPLPLTIMSTVTISLTIIAMVGVRFLVRSMLVARHAPNFDLSQMPVQPQWSIIVLFVVLLLAGLGLVAWMVVQLQRAVVKKSQPV